MRKSVVLLCASALVIGASSANAEIKQGDLKNALGKFLETSDGRQMVGLAVEKHFQEKRDQARKDEEAKQKADLEEQFKKPKNVDISGSPVKGPKGASVTVVEFSDFECPYCQRGNNTMMELLKAYPNDVKLVFKNLPLPFHKNADPAARAALAAGEQGKFWEMHDALFENQRGLSDKLYMEQAKKLGLDMKKFKADYESEKIKKQVKKDTEIAKQLGISGTPGFSVNGVLVKGAYPIDHFKKIVDRWLEKK